MSKKYLREFFNLRHTKCRSCERASVGGVFNGGIGKTKVKPLFHPRPWMSRAQSVPKRKRDLISQEFTNMAEEIEELERVRVQFQEEFGNVRNAQNNLQRLYRRFEAQFIKIEEHLYRSGSVSGDMDTIELFSDLTQVQRSSEGNTQH